MFEEQSESNTNAETIKTSIIAISNDEQIDLFDLETMTKVGEIQHDIDDGEIFAIGITANDREIICSYKSGALVVQNIGLFCPSRKANYRPHLRVANSSLKPSSFAITTNCQNISFAVGYESGLIHLHTFTGKFQNIYDYDKFMIYTSVDIVAGTIPIKHLSFSNNGLYLVSQSNQTCIWDISSGKMRTRFFSTKMHSICLTNSDELYYTTFNKHTHNHLLHCLNIQSNSIHTIKCAANTHIVISPNEKEFLTFDQDQIIKWSSDFFEQKFKFACNRIDSVYYAPNGKEIIILLYNNQILKVNSNSEITRQITNYDPNRLILIAVSNN